MRENNQSLPVWPATFTIPARPPLRRNLSADVCVVGAGIAGLTTAYRLALQQKSVVVLEAGNIGGGETERTTAHLAVALDSGYSELLRVHGEDAIRLAARSHSEAIDEIERISLVENIECGFERVDGYLFSGSQDTDAALKEELDASHLAGIIGASSLDRAPLSRFFAGPAIHYPGQAQFHPLRYLAGLAAAFERLGGRICCGSRVVDVRGGAAARVETEYGSVVRARAVVVATNTPFNDRLVIHTKQASYRTYAVAAPVERGGTARGLYWDMEDPYHYARFAPDLEDGRELLIVGGEDHKTGQQGDAPEVRYARLEQWARERFEGMGEVSHRWSGQVVGTSDGLAFIGRNPDDEPNVFIVTGDCGHGLTHGTIAGLMLPDLIAGRKHAWEELYAPNRISSRSVLRWARENLNSAAQYVSHLLPGDALSVDDIEPGTGAVVRRGFSEVAVYRAPDGTLSERSAVCPHLGAMVCWNSSERTWDCPAHGSRFDVEGRVLNGPAASGLAEVKPVSKPRRVRRRKSAGRRPAAVRRREKARGA